MVPCLLLRGYRNARDENNSPIITPGKDAPIIKWVFEEVVKGVYNVMEIWRISKTKGLVNTRKKLQSWKGK
jgi:hypothetical protein